MLWSLLKWIWTYVNLETIVIVFILVAAIYFAVKSKKKKYPFLGLGGYKPHRLNRRKKKKNKSENKCRDILERIFGVTFKNVRPDWLVNPATGERLELDCYNPDIVTPLGKGLALEYDGIQHSQYTPYFHRHGPVEFVYQTKKDSFKNLICKQKGILLIRVPYYVMPDNFEAHIRQKLKSSGVYMPS
jgi:hypothetical protein